MVKWLRECQAVFEWWKICFVSINSLLGFSSRRSNRTDKSGLDLVAYRNLNHGNYFISHRNTNYKSTCELVCACTCCAIKMRKANGTYYIYTTIINTVSLIVCDAHDCNAGACVCSGTRVFVTINELYLSFTQFARSVTQARSNL